MWFATIAWKNLFRRKLRSAATLAGTALSVATLVALVGLADGFSRSFQEAFADRGIDLVVLQGSSNQRFTTILDQSLGERIARVDGVSEVVPALADLTSLDPTALIGVPLNGWPAGSPLFRQLRMVEGDPLGPEDRGGVLVGRNLARMLHKGVGDVLTVEAREFRIQGVFESQNVYENGSLIVLLPVLQELIDRPGKVSGFAVVLDDSRRGEAQRACRDIQALEDDAGRRFNLDAMPLEEFVATKSELKAMRAMAWVTAVIALAFSGIGLLNTMMGAVFERTSEIGILRALGWKRSRIVRLILLESFLLSLGGSLVGALTGAAVLLLLSVIPAGALLVDGRVSLFVLAEGILLGIVAGAVGGLYPALRAASMSPVRAIAQV